MKPDSTFSKRTVVKRVGAPRPNIVTSAISDITGGFRELQRQMGSAVSNVKSGAAKVRDFMRR